ncbi:hypothetical protein D9758_007981 [Tetrapyrgos nigripes]|uniref:Uncharacterized protein n=1 Tax=Tetrapyrgos nigripes TaxID=182062 RepID=A0A8H5D1F8_9AGAR|nr:hypothetical protein D9758_007981 [Tetrapyrgos nigripes]
MFKRRSPPQMTPSDRVRKLWTEFETWHKEQTFLIEQQITSALLELDTKWRQTPSKKRISKAEHEKRKKEKRQEIQKTFNGNMVREEWQNRLDKEGLQSHDWTDLTEAEQNKVEQILGADLDLDEMELPVVQDTPQTSGSLFAPPLTSDSRLGSVSDTYAVVKPGAFKAVTEEPWMQVVQKSRSDDELSLDASTTSSWGFTSGGDGHAYRSWSSEASRSSTQTSHTSSPEHQTKYLTPEVKQQSLLSAAARRLTVAAQRPSRNDSKPTTSQSLIPLSRSESLNSLDSAPEDPMAFISEPQYITSTASKSGATYIGPHVAEPSAEVDEEAEFHRFKMDIRIQKIREFHDEAALADIKLTVEIDDARRLKKSNKDYEAKLLEEHEQKMLQLRNSKEEERKAIVEAERVKRRNTMRAREQQQQQQRREPAAKAVADTKDCEIPPSVAAQFLKGLREMDGAVDPGGISDSSTIRQQQRSRKPSLFTDWMLGGSDTPTPTARVSAWAAHSSQLSQTPLESSDMFADAPLSKRGASETNSRWKTHGITDATPTKAAEVSPWSMKNVTNSIPGAWNSEPVTSQSPDVDSTPTRPEKVEKVDPPKPAAVAVTGKGKKKKGKTASVAQPAESESSSSSSKAKTATSSSSTVAPEPPSTKMTKETAAAKPAHGNNSHLFPELDRASTPSNSAKSTPMWNILPKSKLPPSSAISSSTSSSSTWSNRTSSSTATSTSTSSSQSTPATDDQQFWVPGAASRSTTSADSRINPRLLENGLPMGLSPTSKAAGKKPEPATSQPSSTGSSSILKKPGSSKSKTVKGSKKKKVTIEEVSDDEGEDPVPDGIERLPSDSRYIMQPAEEGSDMDMDMDMESGSGSHSRRAVERGSGASGKQKQKQQQEDDSYSVWNQVMASSSQDSYARSMTPSQSQGQRQGPERWIPTPQPQSRPRQESNDIWLPGGFSQPVEPDSRSWSSQPTFDWNTHAQAHSGSASGSKSGSGSGDYATWAPSAASARSPSYGRQDRRNTEPESEQDVFLSALDSLEKIVRGNEPSRNGGQSYYGNGYGGEPDTLGRLFSGVGRGLEREKNGDGGEALWHAIESFGQRGTGAAASVW